MYRVVVMLLCPSTAWANAALPLLPSMMAVHAPVRPALSGFHGSLAFSTAGRMTRLHSAVRLTGLTPPAKYCISGAMILSAVNVPSLGKTQPDVSMLFLRH